jgi:hypothetical protein
MAGDGSQPLRAKVTRRPDYDAWRRGLLKQLATACTERGCIKCSTVKPHCHHCGKKAPSWKALEIDHLGGKSWVSRKVNSIQRLRIMEREVGAGAELVGSCGHCNHSSGATRRYRWKTRRRRNRGGAGYSKQAVTYAAYIANQMERPEYREQAERERQEAEQFWREGQSQGGDDGPPGCAVRNAAV